jgi:hypothetical protein
METESERLAPFPFRFHEGDNASITEKSNNFVHFFRSRARERRRLSFSGVTPLFVILE